MAYDHQRIEAHWQKYWEQNQTFRTERRPGKPKFYALDMFPYPSGQGLHVGHPEGYTATDIIARARRMQGWDVLHPMGWDAFGLPAEQHAIQTGTHPRDTTQANIKTFRRQLKSLGFSYDWSREIDTTDPGYVKWTQWIFLQLYKRGLAIQSEIPVNWCPELGTVLANEEVIDGVSERGGYPVVRQPLRQWQLKITAYADRLASDLEALDWPETKLKQIDWIGRSEGAEVQFQIQGRDQHLTVFTTRPDTLFGATYMVIAPDHPMTLGLASATQAEAVQAYAEQASRKSDLERTGTNKEKTGVDTGAFAINPMTGKPIPIFTADYVLGSYGTGAIMAVPAHDERDFEFAQAFGLPIIEVVSSDGTLHTSLDAAYTEPGVAVRSGKYDGLPSADFKRKITEDLQAQGIGRKAVNYKLRDWVFSRQRYWGEPIPVYFPVRTSGNPQKGDAYEIDYSRPIAVEESELPILLPELEDFRPTGDPLGPLAKAVDWRFFQRDGKWYARETNTMPQWAGSCWYYLRFLDPKNSEAAFSQEAYDSWMPVDLYVGGSEHAVLHLLYARFWHKVLYDAGLVKHAEPFTKLVHQGMILGQSYRFYALTSSDGSLKVFSPGSAELVPGAEKGEWLEQKSGQRVEARLIGRAQLREGKAYHPEYGIEVEVVNEKMSKARGNVVNPDEVVREFGADSLRLYEMFMGPLERTKPWQTSGIVGVRNFLEKVNNLIQRGVVDEPLSEATAKQLHRTIKKVSEDIDGLRFNTAISQMMILVNHLGGLAAPPRDAMRGLLLCLAPFAPHLAEESWRALGYTSTVSLETWPTWDEALCQDDVIEMPVQINGKVRSKVILARTADAKEAEAAALADERVKTYLEGKALKKVVFVSGRILNLIIA
ncbi:MAG TPA: leucine--tRNA ligase [Polyangiaceae bacterium]|nr:leucine--tRNA ligase [Polyangiaceae bacterium]